MEKDISNDQEVKKETMSQRVSKKLFRLFYELLKNRNIGVGIGNFLIIVSFLQILGFFYYSKLSILTTDTLTNYANYFFQIIRIYPWVEVSNIKAAYLAIYFILVGLLAIIVCGIAFIMYSINIGKFYFQFPLEMMKALACIFYWILLMPTTEFFLSTFKCSSGNHIILGIKCWTGMHIAYVIISGVCLLSYLTMFVLISLFNNDSNSCSVDVFSRLDSNFELYFTIFRVCGVVINHFVLTIPSLVIYFLPIYTLAALFFVRKYLIELPYYNDMVSVVFGIGIMSFQWESFVFLLSKILEYAKIQITGNILFVVIGIVILSFFTYKLREHIIMHYLLDYKYNKIKSPFTLEIYLTKLRKMVLDQQRSFSDDLILLGFIVHHKNECYNPICPVISCENLYHPLTNTESLYAERTFSDKILLIHLVSSIYNFYSKISKNPELFISSACFNLNVLGHVYKAAMDLLSAEALDISIQQKFSVYRIKMIIESKIKHKYQQMKKTGNSLLDKQDFNNVIELEALYTKLQASIEKSASIHQQFWMNLKTPQNADLYIVFKQGMQIIDYSKEVYECWEKIIKINASYYKALTLYGTYLSKIKNDQDEGGKYLDQAEQFNGDDTFADHDNFEQILYADNTAIIIISGKKEDKGRIIKASSGIFKLIGYNSKEIMGHEVNLLMPSIISDKHNAFLDDYFKIGKERFIHKEQTTYALNKAGEVIAVVIGIKLFSSLQDGIQYIGMLKPTLKNYSFMIVSHDGVINAIDNYISQKLNLGTTIFKENQVGLQVISPQIAEIFSKDHNLDSLVGPNTISFKVPKSILKYVSGGNLSEHLSKLTDEWNEIEQSLSILFDIEDVSYGNNGLLKFKVLKTETDKKEGDDDSSINKRQGIAILDDPDITILKESDVKEKNDKEKEESASIKKEKMSRKKNDIQKDEALDPTLQNLIDTQKNKKNQKSDDNSNVEDTTKSLNNQLRSIRNAVYEKVLPGIIRYVNVGSKLLMLSILVIAVGEFIISYKLNTNMSSYMQLISMSTIRNKRILGLHGSTRALHLINVKYGDYYLINDTLRPTWYNKMGYENLSSLTYKNWSLQNIETFSTQIHDSQNYISSQTKLLSKDSIDMIICNNVTLKYVSNTGGYTEMHLDCWNAFLAVIVHSYKLRSYNSSQIVATDPSVGFILMNTLNSVYEKLLTSSDGVLHNMKQFSSSDVKNMLIILLVLSFLMAVCFSVLLPVTMKIQNEKAQVMNFFSSIKTMDVKMQIKKCNEFFTFFKDDKDESEKNLDDEEENKNVTTESTNPGQSGKKRKVFKMKHFKSSFTLVVFKFILFISVYESFFLLLYFLSVYNTRVNYIRLTELSAIKQRVFSNEFLMKSVIDYISTNGTCTLSNQESSSYLNHYFANLSDNQQHFLETNILNEKLHSSKYHDYFSTMIHNDICNSLYDNTTENYTTCSVFMGGILTKGLQVANTQYWDLLNNLVNDFNKLNPSERTYALISQILSEDRIVYSEMLYYRYLNDAYDLLADTLSGYITAEIKQQNKILLITFVLYMVFLILVYLIVWRVFMDTMRKSYHLTKSMLAIIPAEVIEKHNDMLEFVKKSSKEAVII